MMTTLLEGREVIKRFYEKYDTYVKSAVKFLVALVSFLLLNGKLGFMHQLRSPLISGALAVVCAFLPANTIVLLAGILMVIHAYALSLEACAVTAAVLVVMYLLYFRISSRLGIFLAMTPISFVIGVPYAIPMAGGLLYGPAAAVPSACGTVIYYLLKYMSMNSTSLATGEIEVGATKVASLVDGVVNNKEMFLSVAAMVLTVLVIYFIRRLSIDHSWELAIGIGMVTNIVIHLVGAFLTEVTVQVLPLLAGSVAAAAIAFLIKFFVFSVDYTRTEKVQFEDDEYYYYVKAVPKNAIAVPKKTVKKIVSQKKQTRTIKRIDS